MTSTNEMFHLIINKILKKVKKIFEIVILDDNQVMKKLTSFNRVY